MKTVELKILDSRIGKEFPMPNYITDGSAGIDLRACINDKLLLTPGSKYLINTGISIYINDHNITGIIIPRSGLGHINGIVLGNTMGLIDSDYQGQLKISLLNNSNLPFLLNPGKRIAQIIFLPIIKVNFNIVHSFSSTTNRGSKGFGHSGID